MCASICLRDRVSNNVKPVKYGEVVKHTACQLRVVFLELIPFQVFVAPLRIPYRVCTLLSGDFIRSGYRKAEKTWELNLQRWSLKKPLPQPPSKKYFYADVARNITWEFAQNLTKIILYPLEIVANLFVAFYGAIIDPVGASKAFPKIEMAFARDADYMKNSRVRLVQLSEFIALCRQPKAVWDKYNLYRDWPDYNPLTLRSLLRTINENLLENETFYRNEGLAFDNIKRNIAALRKDIKKFSKNDQDETGEKGELNQTQQQEEIREHLVKILNDLHSIKFLRRDVIQRVQSPDCLNIRLELDTAELDIKQNAAQINTRFGELANIFFPPRSF